MLSVIILTKNEEKNIKDCLESVAFCDEIIVIDDFSTDKTIEESQKSKVSPRGEAGKSPASTARLDSRLDSAKRAARQAKRGEQKCNSKLKIFQRHLNNDFASQRNFGLEKAKGDWVLFVDADERISRELKEEIERATRNSKPDNFTGYYIKRQDYLFGKLLQHGETGDIRVLRLARNGSGKWQRKVHETWDIDSPNVAPLQNAIYHFPHQTITEFLKEINYYSNLNAQVFSAQGGKTHVGEIIFYPVGKFIVNYIVKFGFLDGTPGFIHALMMSLHSFLTRGKLWELQNKNQKH